MHRNDHIYTINMLKDSVMIHHDEFFFIGSLSVMLMSAIWMFM